MPVKDRFLYNINMYVIFLVKKSKFRLKNLIYLDDTDQICL